MGLSASRAVDDRCRRRLVMDSNVSDAASWSDVVKNGEFAEGLSLAARLTISLMDCLPVRQWRYWTVGGLVLTTLVAMSVGWWFAEAASEAGSVMGDLIAPVVERVLRGLGAATWFIAGQLSCLVWWTRSRSRVDYAGRFHAWGWTAAGFFAAGMFSLGNSSQLIACLLAALGGNPNASAMVVTAAWLLPSLVVGLALWATLGSELRGNTAGRVLHSLAAVSGLAVVGFELWTIRTADSLSLEFAARLSLVLLQWCNLMSVLLHVQHTVHVSADPPASSPSWWLVAWRRASGCGLSWVQSIVSRVLAARRLKSVPVDMQNENVAEDETAEEVSSNSGRDKRRMRLDAANGSTQEVRIDEAEQTAKGPSRRSRQAARRS